MIRRRHHTPMTGERHRMLAPLLIGLLILTGCEHKALCYLHPHGAKVRIDVDWREFLEEHPTGMTLTLFPATDGSEPVHHTSHTTSHAVFTLFPDEYTCMVYNQSPSEFGTVTFSGMGSHYTTEVRTVATTSTWYEPATGEKLGMHPEWIAFATEDTEVTDAMVAWQMTDEHLTRTANADARTTKASTDTVIATLVPRNIIYTLHVTVRLRGINNYRSARAVITDMADGYYPGLQQYHEKRVSHLIEEWELTDRRRDDKGAYTGSIVSEITCFGLPYGHRGNAGENLLRLDLLLADNKTIVSRTFNVGNRIHESNYNGRPLHLFLDLDLPDALPDVTPALGDNESGFTAEVNGWGEEENVDVGM